MNLDLYWFFLALIVVFLYFGYHDKSPLLVFLGYGMLFILGNVMIVSGIDYQVGTVVVGSNTNFVFQNYSYITLAALIDLAAALAFFGVFFTDSLWRG